MNKNTLRLVKIINPDGKTYLKHLSGQIGYFHGFFQEANEEGGYPIALIELKNGKVEALAPEDIKFVNDEKQIENVRIDIELIKLENGNLFFPKNLEKCLNNKICATCKHYRKSEDQEPCCECMNSNCESDKSYHEISNIVNSDKE